MRDIDEVTGVIVDAAFGIHTRLGPGLLESVYEAVLARDLERRGLAVQRQAIVRFEYDGMMFDEGLRVDLLVDGRVIVELKSVEHLAPVHGRQVLTYLRLLKQPVGLLINFGSATLKDGVKRIVNNYTPSPTSSATSMRRHDLSMPTVVGLLAVLVRPHGTTLLFALFVGPPQGTGASWGP